MKLKSVILSLVVLMFMACSKPAGSVTYVSEKFPVSGNCGMCKSKIEKAASVSGVKSASWDDVSQMLTVNYAPSKVSLEQLHKNVAAVGYDTDTVKANDKTYSELPNCCKYDRKK